VFVRLRGAHHGLKRRVVRRRVPPHEASSPAPVRLLVRIALWCGWCRFRTSEEVLGPLICSDVEVCLSTQLFGGGGRFLQYGSDEGRVIGSPVEIFNHRCLGDFGDVVPHGLKPLEV
jgi:hypothetical protein